MSLIDIFSNVMAVFWIFVQQVCLCYIKWAYEDIMGRTSRMRAYMVMHVAFLALLILIGFDLLFGLDFVYSQLPKKTWFFYPRLKWNFLCTVMMLIDAHLVFYAWRLYRLYMAAPQVPFKTSSPMLVRVQDLVVTLVFFVMYLWYHAGMTNTALSHRLGDEEVLTLQFFFIKITNFFYAFFEGTAAALLWRIYSRVKKEGLVSHGSA